LTNQRRINHFQHYIPIDDVVAVNYANSSGPGPEGINTYTLFFGSDWRKSKWNQKVIENMISLVPEQQDKWRFTGPDLSADELGAFFWDFITQSRASWTQRQPRVHESGERRETRTEAEARAREYEMKRMLQVHLNTRKEEVCVHSHFVRTNDHQLYM
jgi:hypothetical protein